MWPTSTTVPASAAMDSLMMERTRLTAQAGNPAEEPPQDQDQEQQQPQHQQHQQQHPRQYSSSFFDS